MDEGSERAESSASTSAAPLLFKKRSRARAGHTQGVGTQPSAGSSEGARNRISQSGVANVGGGEPEEGDDDDDDGGSAVQGVVRRSANRGARNVTTQRSTLVPSALRKAGTPRLHDIGDGVLADAEEGNASNGATFAIRKDAIANHVIPSDERNDDAASLPTYLQQQANVSESAYSPAALEALKASTPNRSTLNPGASAISETMIPSDAVIRAAKERRRRLAQEAQAEDDNATSSDYISLRPDKADPHPESRLQREEDELGSGEEDFAAYTGATERVAIDEDGIRKEKSSEREKRREAVEMIVDAEMNEESDESEREWERAQMNRMTNYLGNKEVRKEHTGRLHGKQTFKPAPIPRTGTVSTLSTISMQLQTRLSSIKDATSAQQQLQDDARRKLAQLVEDEARNKAETESAADKEAWFREFEEFIISIATFLEQKKPDLQEVEERWFQQLKMRTSMTGKARAKGQVDQMALFFGVPVSWPTHVPGDATNDDSIEDLPSRDGDAFSEVRILRRQTADAGALARSLLPADQASFELSRETHRKRAEGLLDDVQAAEYRDLAARTQNEDGTTRIHPASLVSRFHRWRRTYAQEYHNAWGGLTLASIADFWIRRSLCAWDVLCCSTGSEGVHRTLHTFPWYSELSHYAEKGHHSAGTEDHSQQDVIGGDDEILAHVITHTVIPYLLKVCGTVEEPAFDPWSSKCNASMLDIVEQLTYVIEKDDTHLQMLIARILSIFKAHVDALSTALNAPPSFAPPAISPQGPTVLLTFTQNTFVVLTKHLLAWNRFVMATQCSAYAGIVDELIAKAVLPLFEMSRLVPGGAEMTAINAKDILARTSRTDLLKQETRTKVEGLALVR